MGRHEIYHTTTQGQFTMENYKFETLTWDDGSHPGVGTSGCSMQMSVDYENATSIPALQTGALVQATWMALEEVVNELKLNGAYNLKLTHKTCIDQAKVYLEDIKTTAEALELSTRGCGLNLDSIKAACNSPTDTSNADLQSHCQKLALIETLQSSNFTNIERPAPDRGAPRRVWRTRRLGHQGAQVSRFRRAHPRPWQAPRDRRWRRAGPER